ncbi:MAG: AAA family ATPase [Deltaproteobacteria bacterium]|nr:AAA family ATPase [Deltaproteobacteria bacterium]MBI3389149.1 AAA family ATPase [Deltaproteobacteria bacterium]
MRRVAIIGSGGTGKSTLATLVSQRTGLPVVHLDPLFWRREWTQAPRDESLRDFDAVIARDRWILDGNFLVGQSGKEDARFGRTDTVIFVDPPRTTCLWRVLRRLVRDRNALRPDLPEGCTERLDFSFLRWVWSYPQTTRPRVLELLERIHQRVDTYRLFSRADVKRFLDSL